MFRDGGSLSMNTPNGYLMYAADDITEFSGTYMDGDEIYRLKQLELSNFDIIETSQGVVTITPKG